MIKENLIVFEDSKAVFKAESNGGIVTLTAQTMDLDVEKTTEHNEVFMPVEKSVTHLDYSEVRELIRMLEGVLPEER